MVSYGYLGRVVQISDKYDKTSKNSVMLKTARQKLQCRTRVINMVPHVLGRVGATVSE